MNLGAIFLVTDRLSASTLLDLWVHDNPRDGKTPPRLIGFTVTTISKFISFRLSLPLKYPNARPESFFFQFCLSG